MSKVKARAWFYAPSWHWFGWSTLLPLQWGNDEFHRKTVVFGWTFTGRVVVALWHFSTPCECGDLRFCPDCTAILDDGPYPCWICHPESLDEWLATTP